MKKSIAYHAISMFLGLTSLILLCSCGKEINESATVPDQSQIANCSPESKAALIGSYRDYMVSQQDIESYAHFLNSNRNKDDKRGDVISVSPYEYEGEPAYYALNYENGWDLISSDKRGPIVLGRSETGSFDYDALIPPQQTWIDCLCDDIYSRRHFENEYYGKLSEEAREKESSCVEQWLMATANPDYIALFSETDTKVAPVDDGHWEVFDTFTETSTEDSGHMLTTHWHQEYPYNEYCPLKSNSQTERAPAGCVAIAAAQEMYYLHGKIQKPVESPTFGYITGNINQYVSSFVNYAPYTWNTMDNTADNNYAALLIGDIGKRLNMNYGNNGSGADDADLPSLVFSHYGIDCSRISFDSDQMNVSLTARVPVIVSAFRLSASSNLTSWIAGHCFIADRCIQTVTKYYTIYRYVYDQPGVMHPIPPDNMSVLTMTHRELDLIGFNWGWGEDWDSQNYAPNGSWINDGKNYRYSRKMIYEFE